MHTNPNRRQQRYWFVQLETWVVLCSISCHLGCSGQGAPTDDVASINSVSQRQELDDTEDLLRRMLESKEPSMGHLSEIEEQIAAHGVKVLPQIIPWMTSENASKRYHAARILERVSMSEFGWHPGLGDADWMRQDWIEFWQKLGGYSPYLSDQAAKNSQTLWTSYLQKLTESGGTFGVGNP